MRRCRSTGQLFTELLLRPQFILQLLAKLSKDNMSADNVRIEAIYTGRVDDFRLPLVPAAVPRRR